MTLLLDATTFGSYSQVDISTYAPAYLNGLFTVAHSVIAGYLDFDPAVQVHAGEEGEILMPGGGRDAFQMIFRTKHRPLTSTVPSGTGGVFLSLSLLFPAPFPTLDLLSAPGAVGALVVRQTSGRVTVPFLGNAGLPMLYFANASGLSPNAGPTGYRATYTAGYAISAADQAAYPTARAVPPQMQQACAWVVEAILAQGGRVRSDPQAALSGEMAAFKNLDYAETYQRDMRGTVTTTGPYNSLLYGTQQGRWAMEALQPFQKGAAERVLLL